MKKKGFLTLVVFLMSSLILVSCGPLIISSRPEMAPPHWFYPNRIEPVRYVYFPDHVIYYDLLLRQYLYLENNVWIRVNVLPSKYRSLNLNRSKFLHVKGYRGDGIQKYHRAHYSNSPRSSKTSIRRNR